MATVQRVYNVPLRSGFQKVPNYKKTPKAVKTLREFMKQHMKSDDIRIGPFLNKQIWEKGIKNPPHHVKVSAQKDDEGVVLVELEGKPLDFNKAPEQTQKAPEGLREKLMSQTGIGKKEDKKEDASLEETVAPEKKEEKPAAKESQESKIPGKSETSSPTEPKAETPKVEAKSEAPKEEKKEEPAPAEPVVEKPTPKESQ